MLVTHRVGRHAVEVLHGGGPVHVAVAHQGEMGVDAFRREGVGQGLVDGEVLHCAGGWPDAGPPFLSFTAAMGTGAAHPRRVRLPRSACISDWSGCVGAPGQPSRSTMWRT